MAARAVAGLAIALAAAPAGISFAVESAAKDVQASRSIVLEGPVRSFSQTQTRIDVRISTVNQAPHRLEIAPTEAAGEAPVVVDFRKGQTFASVRLPEDLAGAPALRVSIRPAAQAVAAAK